MRHARTVVSFGSVALSVAWMLTAAPAANATVSLTTFDQATANAAAQEGMSNGLWGDYSEGNSSRPFVESLAVTNGDDTTSVVVNGTTSDATPPDAGLATVVSPVNLCKTGSSSNCYETPNRIALTFGAQGATGVSQDLTNVSQVAVSADSIIDVTVDMNSFGSRLRWTQISGQLLYWRVSNPGTNNAKVHARFRPATVPAVNWDAVGPNGCTATPINNCDISQSALDYLGASMLFSVDDTLAPELSGAAFSTDRAFFGYLTPGGSAAAPVMDFQLASTHLTDAGALNQGSLRAFLPAAALLNLYGIPPEDAATAMTTARTGSAGTNSAPTYTRWNAATHGSDGLLVSVGGITFSAPKYRVTRKVARVATGARVGRVRLSRKKTVLRTSVSVSGAALASCVRTRCRVNVVRLGSRTSLQRANVGVSTIRARNALIRVAPSKLARRARYLVTVRPLGGAQRGRLIASGLGSVR